MAFETNRFERSEEDAYREQIRSLHFSGRSGRHVCPFCSDGRRPEHRKDKTLATSTRDGMILYKCHHCDEQGGFPVQDQTRPMIKETVLSAIGPAVKEPKVKGLSDAAIAFFMGRGISEETALEAGVYSADHFVGGVEQDSIWFPYGGKKPYAHKIRAVSSKAFTQAGGASTFWLIEQAQQDQDLFVVEGEIDALTVREVGFRSVVSVPNGAPVRVSDGKIDPREDKKFQYVWQGKAQLSKAKRVIIATDNDEPGQALAEELARRMGKAKVWRIMWPEGIKDANDALVKLGAPALKELLSNPEPWPVAGVHDAHHYSGQVMGHYHKGLGRGRDTGFGCLDQLYSVAPGQLTVLTGIPGMGKSTFMNAMLVNMVRQNNWTVAIYSSETPPDIHIPMLAALYLGKPFFQGPTPRMSEDELKRGIEWVNDHFVFIDSSDTCTYEQVIERLEAAVLRYGIRGFIIDPANYLRKPNNCDEVEWVGEMLNAFRSFGQSHGCHAWVVAHPKKMQPRQDGSTPVPSGYDITGSAHWYNRPDFGLSVHRAPDAKHITEIHVWKVRFWWTGKEGSAELYHDRPTGRFSETPFERVIYSGLEGSDPWER